MSEIMAERLDNTVIVLDNELTLDEAAKLRDQLDGCLMDYDAAERNEYAPKYPMPARGAYPINSDSQERFKWMQNIAIEIQVHKTRCENLDVYYMLFGCPPPGAVGTRELLDMCWKLLRAMREGDYDMAR